MLTKVKKNLWFRFVKAETSSSNLGAVLEISRYINHKKQTCWKRFRACPIRVSDDHAGICSRNPYSWSSVFFYDFWRFQSFEISFHP